MVPQFALADASVRQDSCVYYMEGENLFARVKFTVVNFSLPAPICDLHFIPEPQPPLSECTMIDTYDPMGWSSFLNPFGGADWFAHTPLDCIEPGTAKSGYGYLLDPGFCCYIVQFTGPTGEVLLEQEECFCDKPVPTEDRTWGAIKALYR
jgi:hypothetical protein